MLFTHKPCTSLHLGATLYCFTHKLNIYFLARKCSTLSNNNYNFSMYKIFEYNFHTEYCVTAQILF